VQEGISTLSGHFYAVKQFCSYQNDSVTIYTL